MMLKIWFRFCGESFADVIKTSLILSKSISDSNDFIYFKVNDIFPPSVKVK